MAEYFMGQELIQGELPANSPKPAATPPEGVIMTDVSRDGWSRRYIYIAMAGAAPEEILISETPPTQKARVSGAAVAVEDDFSSSMEGVSVPDGVILPEGAVLPENAVFSGIPSQGRPTMGRPAVPTAAPRIAVPVQGQNVPLVARQNPLPQPQQSFRTNIAVAAPSSVPTVSIQKAAPPAPVMVQPQGPLPGVEVQVPFIQTPIDKSTDIPSNVRISNSIDSLRPAVAQSVMDSPRPVQQERPAMMLGQISRPLPLTTQEGRKDTYPVSNPIAPAGPMGGMSQIGGSPGLSQNQIPLRHMGQTPAPAPAPASTGGKCPGAVEMPDGTTIEPDQYITLAALCELMPFLASTLTDLQAKSLAPGQKVSVVGQQPNGQTVVPTSASFGPAGQGGPMGRAVGGMGSFGGGGGSPGPAGSQGPRGLTGPAGPGSITEPPVVKVDGDFVAGPGAFVPVPGTAVPFSMSTAGVAEVKVLVTLGTGPTQQAENVQLGIRVNGTDYPLTVRLLHTFAANVGEFDIGQCFLFPIQLPAGSYTAELLLRGLLPGEFGGGTGASAAVNANPSIPLIITVSHN